MLTGPRILALLLASCALLYLVGNGRVSLWDRDEPRYAQCSRQMLQSGDWVVPRLYDDIRPNKPPLAYWCQAACMKVLGETAFAARLPSAVAMLLTLLLLGIVIGRAADEQRAVWTVLVMSTAFMVVFAAKTSLTDSLLLLFTTIALLCMAALRGGSRSWGVVITMAAATGLAALTKGPFILGVLGATGLVLLLLHLLTRRPASELPAPSAAAGALTRGTLQVLAALLIVAAVVGPWVYLVSHRSPGFLSAAARQARMHVEQGGEGHGRPAGTQLLMATGTFLPWTLLLPLTLALAWKNRRVPLVQFALAAAIGPWLMSECIATKLPQYLLPAFPALAFLTADAIVRCLRGQQSDLRSPAFVGATGIWAAAMIAFGSLPWFATRYFTGLPLGAMALLTASALAYGLTVHAFFRAGRAAAGLWTMGLGMMAVLLVLFGVYLPRANFLRVSIQTAEQLKRLGVVGPHQVWMLDYKEPSLAFYQGGTIREHHGSLPPAADLARWPRWLVVTRDVWDKAAPDVRARFHVVFATRGLSYNEARRVEVMVIEQTQLRYAGAP